MARWAFITAQKLTLPFQILISALNIGRWQYWLSSSSRAGISRQSKTGYFHFVRYCTIALDFGSAMRDV